jgi:hypothetical protein
MKGKDKSLMLDSKKKGKKKDPHTAKRKRCFKKVSKKETDETAAKICTDSVGYEDSFKERSKHESIDEKKLLSLIKEKENPRMTKKGLIEYIKSTTKKEVIKSITKKGMVSEASMQDNLGKHMRYFKGEKGAIQKVMKYLEMLRQSGLENMHGAYPILQWHPDDLHRYLYGKRKDLDSLEGYREKEVIGYLVEHKQEIRDILTRVALRRAEELGGDEMGSIQQHFNQAAFEAFNIWVGIMSI